MHALERNKQRHQATETPAEQGREVVAALLLLCGLLAGKLRLLHLPGMLHSLLGSSHLCLLRKEEGHHRWDGWSCRMQPNCLWLSGCRSLSPFPKPHNRPITPSVVQLVALCPQAGNVALWSVLAHRCWCLAVLEGQHIL